MLFWEKYVRLAALLVPGMHRTIALLLLVYIALVVGDVHGFTSVCSLLFTGDAKTFLIKFVHVLPINCSAAVYLVAFYLFLFSTMAMKANKVFGVVFVLCRVLSSSFDLYVVVGCCSLQAVRNTYMLQLYSACKWLYLLCLCCVLLLSAYWSGSMRYLLAWNKVSLLQSVCY